MAKSASTEAENTEGVLPPLTLIARQASLTFEVSEIELVSSWKRMTEGRPAPHRARGVSGLLRFEEGKARVDAALSLEGKARVDAALRLIDEQFDASEWGFTRRAAEWMKPQDVSFGFIDGNRWTPGDRLYRWRSVIPDDEPVLENEPVRAVLMGEGHGDRIYSSDYSSDWTLHIVCGSEFMEDLIERVREGQANRITMQFTFDRGLHRVDHPSDYGGDSDPLVHFVQADVGFKLYPPLPSGKAYGYLNWLHWHPGSRAVPAGSAEPTQIGDETTKSIESRSVIRLAGWALGLSLLAVGLAIVALLLRS